MVARIMMIIPNSEPPILVAFTCAGSDEVTSESAGQKKFRTFLKMELFSPNLRSEWNEVEKILESVACMPADCVTEEVFVEVLKSLHASFSPTDKTNQFDQIPNMLHSIRPETVEQFLTTTLPQICKDLAIWFPSHSLIPYLPGGAQQTIEFSPLDAYHLIAACFLGIPLFREDESTIRDGTCVYLFTNRPKQVAKLTCFLNYLNVIVAAKNGQLAPQVATKILNDRTIYLDRQVADKYHGGEWWISQSSPMTAFNLMNQFVAIETAHECVQADFANKHVGGGVLRTGCVQEEIRFLISPETILSVFLCDVLGPNETVLIRNTIQFSSYTGYSNSFKCTGLSRGLVSLVSGESSDIPWDDVLCIDATPYGAIYRDKQFVLSEILVELEKCRCGLSYSCHKPFATGNWGCGVFGGDPQLKAIIQWIAASVCGKSIVYFPFDDGRTSIITELVDLVIANNIHVGKLFELLVKCIADSTITHDNTIQCLINNVQSEVRNS